MLARSFTRPAVASARSVSCRVATANGVVTNKGKASSNELALDEVHALLNVICEETELAEVSLKMGEFKMYVKRKVGTTAAAAHAPVAHAVAEAPVAASAPAPTPAPVLSSDSESEYEYETEDEDKGILNVSSPKVGVFRRYKMQKGKRISKGPVAEEGQQLKKGAAIGFIEQLGTYVPVEMPQAGEIVSFLLEDGAPVEYKQNVAEYSVYFGNSSSPGSGRAAGAI